MFSKLLKHEWKANAGLLWVLSACAIGVGLLGGGVMRAIRYFSDKMYDDQMASVAISGLGSMMVFVVLALLAYILAVQFINVFRFYKNKFTDEGYLTFTLPVSSRQIFLSSFLNILAWLVISVLVLLVAIMLIFLITTDWNMAEFGEDLKYIVDGTLYQENWGIKGLGTYLALSVLQVVVAPIYAIVLLMTSITLGCVLAKKHKILATIGMYYCINMVVNIISTVVTMVPTILLLGDSVLYGTEQYFVYMSWSAGLTIALQLGLTVGGYFWSTYLMKHKLNLP